MAIRRFVIVILSMFVIVNGQISDTYKHLSDKQMKILKNDLKTSRKLSLAGSAVHLGGVLLFISSIPLILDEKHELGASFLITGFSGIYAGPALSCGGASMAKRVYRRSDLSTMGKPRGWIYYGTGLFLTVARYIGTYAGEIETFGYLFFAEEALNIISMVNSSRYIKDNQYKHTELTDVKVQFSPMITFSKGLGLKLSAAF